jgi:hypothetical protein
LAPDYGSENFFISDLDPDPLSYIRKASRVSLRFNKRWQNNDSEDNVRKPHQKCRIQDSRSDKNSSRIQRVKKHGIPDPDPGRGIYKRK